MFGRIKKSQISGFHSNIRRRFHHALLSKRKEHIPLQRHHKPPITSDRRAWYKAHARGGSLFRHVAAAVIIGGITIGGIYATLFSDFFRITTVQLEKNGEAVAASKLTPFLDTFRGEHMLFLRTEKTVQAMRASFKNAVASVAINKSYPHKVIVHVEEYPTVLNVAIQTPEKSERFIINQIGAIISTNAEDKTLPYLSVELSKSPVQRGLLIASDTADVLVHAYKTFTELFGIKIVKGEWKKTERELHLFTEKNFSVWIDLTEDVDAQLGKLKRALPKLDIYNTPLEYIDLRIAAGDSEKVIFKRRR